MYWIFFSFFTGLDAHRLSITIDKMRSSTLPWSRQFLDFPHQCDLCTNASTLAPGLTGPSFIILNTKAVLFQTLAQLPQQVTFYTSSYLILVKSYNCDTIMSSYIIKYLPHKFAFLLATDRRTAKTFINYRISWHNSWTVSLLWPCAGHYGADKQNCVFLLFLAANTTMISTLLVQHVSKLTSNAHTAA